MVAIANKKKEAVQTYYQQGEGKKALALAELFLDELKEKIKCGELSDLTRDYVFQTTQYECRLWCSGRFSNIGSLAIYQREEKIRLFENGFQGGGFYVSFPYNQTWVNSYFSKHPLFTPLLRKLEELFNLPFVEITLPEEKIKAILQQKEQDVGKIVADTRDFLTKHRKQFDKKAFANCAHTIRTLEQTLPHLTPHNAYASELSNMIQADLMKLLAEYVALPDTARVTQEERLLRYMNLFYLQALHVLESN